MMLEVAMRMRKYVQECLRLYVGHAHQQYLIQHRIHIHDSDSDADSDAYLFCAVCSASAVHEIQRM